MTHHLDLTAITLDRGCHEDPADGHCLLEVVSMFADEPFSDSPSCVSPILRSFGISWNDALNTADRQQLKQYIPRLVGTAGDPAADERRGIMAADWLIRVHTPAWLRLAGLTEQADRLEALPEITSFEDTVPLKPVLRAVRADADAAGAAARDAVKAAAWDTARAAAWDAAWVAVWAAAGDTARVAARTVAGDGAWAAAGAAAWDAVWDAAGAAAWDTARDTARDAARAAWVAVWAAAWAVAWDAVKAAVEAAAGDVVGDVARDALQPTVEQLQASAHDLFSRMIDVATEDRT